MGYLTGPIPTEFGGAGQGLYLGWMGSCGGGRPVVRLFPRLLEWEQSMGSHQPPELSAPAIVALHLAPGVVFSGFLYLFSGELARHGIGAYPAELMAIPICLAPLLAGIVLFWSRRTGEAGTILGAITYRDRSSWHDYALTAILLYAFWGLLSTLVIPLTGFLETRFFGWFPDRLGTQAMVGGMTEIPHGWRPAFFAMAVLFSGFLAPLVEEAYFRGFLLPRMSRLGGKAPVINAFFFGLYHFFCPWNLPAIFLAFLPVAFVVRAKRNFRISLVLHVMYNLTGVLTVFLRRG